MLWYFLEWTITQLASTPKLTSEKFVKTSVTTGQQQYYSELSTTGQSIKIQTNKKMYNVEMHLLQSLLITFIPLNTAVALSN